MTIGWEHPLDGGAGWEGLNDGDMEHFIDDPIVKSAREGIQNSLDARAKGNDGPVIVKFKLIDINSADIPNLNELIYNFEHALDSQKYHKPNDQGSTAKDTIKLYEKALELLKKDKVKIFQIEDSNTTGMYWDEGKESPFFNYIKARSYSSKPEDALGAFGIGKLAPFVVSDLRTVFASSVYKIGNKIFQSTQGKSKFSSLYDDNEDSSSQRTAVGYWGNKASYNPVSVINSGNHRWMQKSKSDEPKLKDIGTIISSLGFNGNEDGIWNFWVIEAVLMNFFQSIYDQKLEIIVEGNTPSDNLTVNHKTIDMLFDPEGVTAQKIKRSRGVDSQNWMENFLCTRDFLELLKKDSSDVEIYNLHLPELGHCLLRLKVAEGLNQRICFSRDGMKITEKISAPGLSNFKSFMDFVAHFECINPEGNTLLRGMENPAHNSWDWERPKNNEDKYRAKRALKELADKIREILSKSAKKEVSEAKDIDLMIKYGFVFDGNDNNQGSNREIHPFKNPVNIEMIPVKTPSPPSKKAGKKGGNKGVNEEKNGSKKTSNSSNNNQSGGSGNNLLEHQIHNFRSVKGSTSKDITINFTPKFTGKADLYLFKSQADGKSEKPIIVDKWNDLPATQKTLRQEYVNGERCAIKVSFKNSFNGSLEISLISVQEN